MSRFLAFLVVLAVATVSAASSARADGSRSFVARPTLGAAVLQLPSTVSWRTTPLANGAYRVALAANIDVRSAIANIKVLSAKALDRSAPCSDVVKITGAAAKLTGATTLRYDLRFYFVKRVCAGTLPLDFPANVACAAKIALSTTRSAILIDVQGASTPPCRVEGAYQSVSDAIYSIVGVDVFKRHAVDLAQHLPPAFKGVTINIRSLAFDLPPAAAVLQIAGDSTMSAVQFKDFIARLDAAAPKTN